MEILRYKRNSVFLLDWGFLQSETEQEHTDIDGIRWALIVLLLSTLVRRLPTELILFHKYFHPPPEPPWSAHICLIIVTHHSPIESNKTSFFFTPLCVRQYSSSNFLRFISAPISSPNQITVRPPPRTSPTASRTLWVPQWFLLKIAYFITPLATCLLAQVGIIVPHRIYVFILLVY
mgnify:CR=1 FL=1